MPGMRSSFLPTSCRRWAEEYAHEYAEEAAEAHAEALAAEEDTWPEEQE